MSDGTCANFTCRSNIDDMAVKKKMLSKQFTFSFIYFHEYLTHYNVHVNIRCCLKTNRIVQRKTFGL